MLAILLLEQSVCVRLVQIGHVQAVRLGERVVHEDTEPIIGLRWHRCTMYNGLCKLLLS